MAYQQKSQVLLLVEANTNVASYIIPGKLFEYLNANRPIVAIGPKHSDIQTILKETNTGMYFNYEDKNALKTHLLHLFGEYKKDTLSVSPKNINLYSRKSCTQQLAELLNAK